MEHIRRRFTFFIAAIFAAVLFLSTTATAQIDTGTIVGTVRDPSGAAIARAAVSVTNAATGVKQETATNDAGEYQFTALPPGTYTLRVTAPGFGTQIENNIEIHVQSRASVDFALKVGDVADAVEVRAAAPLLQTESADVGGVVQERQIRDLPLNGRRYADLALLEAGIQKNLTNPNNQAPDRFSSNGNLETQNYFSLDGIDNNSGSTNLQEGSVQAVQPPPDAVQEFRVQTRTYSAEFGTSAGAVINVSIKSGTNGFHGDVWEFLRNSKLDANTFFNNAGSVPRGRFSQNQFGGTIGGPIIRNRTFFFFDAQDFTSRKASTVNSTVPTPLMKQGNFTELKAVLADANVAGQSSCVSGNIIAQRCIDPVGSKLLALYPTDKPGVGPAPPITSFPTRFRTIPTRGTRASIIISRRTTASSGVLAITPSTGRTRRGRAIRSSATATLRRSIASAVNPSLWPGPIFSPRRRSTSFGAASTAITRTAIRSACNSVNRPQRTTVW